MKFTKTELSGLLDSVPAQAARTAAPQKGAGELNPAYVRACCATLWQRVPANTLTKKEARSKMLELLTWLSNKHAWTLKENSRQEYPFNGLKVDGRVHAVLQSSSKALVIEICFELQEPLLLKLWAAHSQGRQVLLLWGGAPTPELALATRAQTLLGARYGDWLHFAVLNRS
jgi:hypothetical protein